MAIIRLQLLFTWYKHFLSTLWHHNKQDTKFWKDISLGTWSHDRCKSSWSYLGHIRSTSNVFPRNRDNGIVFNF